MAANLRPRPVDVKHCGLASLVPPKEGKWRSKLRARHEVAATALRVSLKFELKVPSNKKTADAQAGRDSPQAHPSFIEVSGPAAVGGGNGEVAGAGEDGTERLNANGAADGPESLRFIAI